MNQSQRTLFFDALKVRIERKTAVVGVCGLGYVGLPLARAMANHGLKVVGFDIDDSKIKQLSAGESYIRHIPSRDVSEMINRGSFIATSDFARVQETDVIIICVPTPLSRHREPDLSFVVSTVKSVAANSKPGQLLVLESTTYPGTTDEVVIPILLAAGRTVGQDFFVAFSPEREDPGNLDFDTGSIPKVVGGSGQSLDLAVALYKTFLKQVVAVSSTATAEAVKLTENIFRSVNIALVNELKIIYSAMGIDIWEVIDAAKTKPFGFMPFYPGPGLGGHCIPVDPFYLTWKAKEFDITTRFIELAGQINTNMPQHVVNRLTIELDVRLQIGLSGSSILVVGLAYKKNVDDMRESPAIKIIELLEKRGALVSYLDPFIPEIPRTREHVALAGRMSIKTPLSSSYQAAIIVTDHDQIDYMHLAGEIPLIVDTRNVCARLGIIGNHIVKA